MNTFLIIYFLLIIVSIRSIGICNNKTTHIQKDLCVLYLSCYYYAATYEMTCEQYEVKTSKFICNFDDYFIKPINETFEPIYSHAKYSNHLKVGVIQSNPPFYGKIDELTNEIASQTLEHNINKLSELIIQAANNNAE
jgi:hypothetical protein